jgi:hypothetical protein
MSGMRQDRQCLVTHQRDAIRMTMYAIGKRKGRREEH